MTGELRIRLSGVIGMLTLREGWRTAFDISPQGFWGSFSAALWGLPIYAMTLVIQTRLVRGLAEASPGGGEPRSAGIGYAIALYVAMWAYFPIIARLFTRLFGLNASFAPWVIVHNWTLLFLLIARVVTALPFMAGIIDAESFYAFSSLFFAGVVYAHVRAAMGALDAPWSLAVGGACLALVSWLLIQVMMASLFTGALVQA